MFLHPLALALQINNWQIFIPTFSPLSTFFRMGGKTALIIFTIGVLVAVFRKYIKGWKIVHMLQLVAFLLAGIHAWLIGTDTKTLPAKILLALMMASASVLFFRNTKRFKYLLKK
jgi:predicted ferric reductase